MTSEVCLERPAGCSRVKVRRIFCLTRNFAAHAKEMGADPAVKPAIFTKPDTAVLPLSPGGDDIVPYPHYGEDLHHEVELVLLVLDPEKEEVAAGVGVDLTLRDIQADLKKRSLPWVVAKGFDASAPVGPFYSRELLDPEDATLTLSVNGTERQNGHSSQMIIPVRETLPYVARYFPLLQGDLIFTGTPEGVASLSKEDRVVLTLADSSRTLEPLSFTVT